MKGLAPGAVNILDFNMELCVYGWQLFGYWQSGQGSYVNVDFMLDGEIIYTAGGAGWLGGFCTNTAYAGVIPPVVKCDQIRITNVSPGYWYLSSLLVDFWQQPGVVYP